MVNNSSSVFIKRQGAGSGERDTIRSGTLPEVGEDLHRVSNRHCIVLRWSTLVAYSLLFPGCLRLELPICPPVPSDIHGCQLQKREIVVDSMRLTRQTLPENRGREHSC